MTAKVPETKTINKAIPHNSAAELKMHFLCLHLAKISIYIQYTFGFCNCIRLKIQIPSHRLILCGIAIKFLCVYRHHFENKRFFTVLCGTLSGELVNKARLGMRISMGNMHFPIRWFPRGASMDIALSTIISEELNKNRLYSQISGKPKKIVVSLHG